jgi:hypothetical protein
VTTATWIFAVVMLGSAAAAASLGRQLRREIRSAGERRRALALAADDDAETVVEVECPPQPPAVVVEPAAVAAPQRPRRDRATSEILAIPELLLPYYSGLSELPEAKWSLFLEPLSIPEFESGERLIAKSMQYPVIATPIHAFTIAAATHPGQLLRFETTFSAGTSNPFAFVKSGPHADDPQLTAGALSGAAIGVLGRRMSPTVVLLEVLHQLQLEPRLWDVRNWRDRQPREGCVDVMVGSMFGGQVQALESGQVDYALVIYPHNHDKRIGDSPASELQLVTIDPLERGMHALLSEHALNVLVANADLYESDAGWHDRVEIVREAVRTTNGAINAARARGAGNTIGDDEIVGGGHTTADVIARRLDLLQRVSLLPPLAPEQVERVIQQSTIVG